MERARATRAARRARTCYTGASVKPFSLFAPCAPGLEPLLLAELEELGVRNAEALPGGVAWAGHHGAIYRANLGLGLATQVRVRLGRFRASKLPELRRKARQLPWGPWVGEGGVDVRAVCKRSKLHHGGAVAERVAQAAAEAVGEVPIAEGATRVLVRIVENEVEVSVDPSGEPLHRRGYRLATAKAPLREDLARALLRVSGWDAESPLVDPMMGAGTIAIEAALLARRLPPGGRRRFAFEDTPGFDAPRYAKVRAELEAKTRPALPFPIHGSDRDAGALEAARANAERAGVLADLRLREASLSDAFAEVDGATALVTNPPWGARIGDGDALRDLYASLGELVRAREGLRLAFACGDPDLARAVGLPIRSALMTDAGGTKVRFFVGA